MVRVYTEMLQSAAPGQLEDEALQAIEFLHKAALQMQRLLDGLAELVTATARPVRTNSSIKLELPLRQALIQMKPELTSADAQVSYTDLPTVPGDFDRLQLVFQHLIRNAVQYRGERTPEIHISVQPGVREWIIAIRDNGEGIAPEFDERIFELYTRLHGKSLPGNGLGLAICRAIVGAHDGTIAVTNGPDGSACFAFTLPKGVPPVVEAEQPSVALT